MGVVPSRIPTAVAWVVAALLVAWAPLFHAICVAPAESAAASHIMADGTVMTIAAPVDSAHSGHDGAPATAGAADSASFSSAALALAGPATELLDASGVVGMIVVFAGFAVLSLAMFVRRCAMLPVRGDPPRRWPSAVIGRDIRARHPFDVDLQRLGISRT
jgi:hypothetical protein